MVAKFTLKKNPTFKAKVSISRPGEEDGELEVTYKHLSQKQFQAVSKPFQDKLAKLNEDKLAKLNEDEGDNQDEILNLMAGYIMDIAEGWELDDEFSHEVIVGMIGDYPRSFDAITSAYQREIWGLRQK
uniref:Tail length tape measure protein n=1 Tax=Pectobacterium phage Taid TaxID=3158139 RepID=A0AB39AC90_9CAUD